MCSATRSLCSRASGEGSGSDMGRKEGVFRYHSRPCPTRFQGKFCSSPAEREAKALRGELNAARVDSVALVQADLLDIAGLPEIVRNTVNRFERLDALVNNASTFFPTPVGEMTQATWESLIGANLRAPLFLAQAAAPHLKKAGGTIVNITDIHAERPLKNYVIYSVAKAGLVGLTRSLARELGPEVRVNGVAPGAIIWPED